MTKPAACEMAQPVVYCFPFVDPKVPAFVGYQENGE